jgi:hypothetical protein
MFAQAVEGKRGGAINKASNGNGRPKTADGSYPGNNSLVHLFEIPAA